MGRPKKSVAAPAAKSTNQKPGRGRPKKAVAAPAVVAKPVATAPKKGRGRPKKA